MRPQTSARKPVAITASLSTLFFFTRHACWALRLIRPLAVPITLIGSPTLRRNLEANARVIFGRRLSPRERRLFFHGVVRNFYDFVVDLGKSSHASAEAILRRVECVEGEATYLQARSQKRGAVLVTAHMGAFEVGLAALRRAEPHVHVVFKKDEFSDFERIRSRVRSQLGVIEEPIDDGYDTLVRLRDALAADHVVVMQGDRAMPGQKSVFVPFLAGRLQIPIGPVKLARLTGSPIIPVFVVRGHGRAFRIHLGTPIEMDPSAEQVNGVDPALCQLAQSLESFVRQYPTQWLVLNRAFAEDSTSG